jgi:hypothetical protein
MSALTITNHDLSDGIIAAGEFEDQLFTSAGAATYLDNTLVALDTSTLKMVPYAKGGSTNGNGVVYGLLTKGIVAAGAGDTPVRIMTGGRVLKDKTVIYADGDASNIDNAVKILCLDKGLTLVDSTNLHVADNS